MAIMVVVSQHEEISTRAHCFCVAYQAPHAVAADRTHVVAGDGTHAVAAEAPHAVAADGTHAVAGDGSHAVAGDGICPALENDDVGGVGVDGSLQHTPEEIDERT